MQSTLRIDQLEIRRPPRERLGDRAWREWCFVRSVARTLRLRLGLLVVVLLLGGLAFSSVDEGKPVGLAEGVHTAFGLIFGEAPAEFPRSLLLRTLLFVIPLIGLTVIVESLIELSSMVRDRKRNERAWCEIMASTLRGHVVLVGLGRLGYRTYLLLRRLGVDVVVLERDPSNQFLEEVRRLGDPLLVGDARLEAMLERANVRHADAIVLATTDDLANLEIALDARRLRPEIRVVLRMFDQNMADKIRDGFNIHIAMSQSAISAPAFATAAVDRSIVSSTVVDNQLLVMVRWRVQAGGPIDGKSVIDVMREFGVGIVRYAPASSSPGPEGSAPGGRTLFPRPDTRFAPGDELLVQGLYDEVRALQQGRRAVGRVKEI